MKKTIGKIPNRSLLLDAEVRTVDMLTAVVKRKVPEIIRIHGFLNVDGTLTSPYTDASLKDQWLLPIDPMLLLCSIDTNAEEARRLRDLAPVDIAGPTVSSSSVAYPAAITEETIEASLVRICLLLSCTNRRFVIQ